MFGLGLGEFAIILGAGLLLFGAKRLPELARNMGQSIKEFRTSLRHDPAPPSEDRREDTSPSSPDNGGD